MTKRRWVYIATSAVAIAAFALIISSHKGKVVVCKLTIDPFYETIPSFSKNIEVTLYDTVNSHREIQSQFLDTNWTAIFTNINSNVLNVSFHYYRNQYKAPLKNDFDTVIRQIHIRDSVTVVEITYPYLSHYICPVCHKYDQVIPIKYGIGVPAKIGAKIEGVDYLDGGCCVTKRFYCKRDYISF